MSWITTLWCLLSVYTRRSHGQHQNLQHLEHEYRIQEELPIGSQIGNLMEDLLLYKSQSLLFGKSQAELQSKKDDWGDLFEFSVLNSGHLGVNSVEVKKDGRVLVARRIDREQLCLGSQSVGSPLDSVYSVKFVPKLTSQGSHSSMASSSHCIITLKLSVFSRAAQTKITGIKSSKADNPQAILTVRLLIDDINDNAPYWPGHLKRFQVVFRDGDPIGERRTLPPAVDLDSGLNGRLIYELVPTTHSDKNSGTFSLIDHAMEGIYLCATKQVDREEREAYQYILKAIDHSNPDDDQMPSEESRFTSTLVIDVHIEDINDNTPLFVQPIFTPNTPIPETTPVGTTVLILNATDADAGINGAFHFGFSREHAWLPTEIYAKQYFDIRSNGHIVVRRSLDVDRDKGTPEIFRQEQRNGVQGLSSSGATFLSSSLASGTTIKFRFHVVVEDEAVRPYSRSSEATVVITVSDENDEAPIVEIREVREDIEQKANGVSGPTGNFNFLSVTENKPIGTAVATLQAYDPDFEGTDHVECRLKTSNFSLVQTSNQQNPIMMVPGSVAYHLQTAIELDREVTPVQLVPISCIDTAGHLTERNFSVYVLDENDNPPRFVHNTFHMQVWENMSPGTQLQRMENVQSSVHSNLLYHHPYFTAVDSDTGANADVFYQLIENGMNATTFKIDPKTGTITTTVSFDREAVDHYTLYALAIDHGIPPLTSTSTVKITVLDVNDNAPQFGSVEYTFHLAENQPRATQVGQVTATDLDSDIYGPIHYFVGDESDATNFRIDKMTGVIRCRQALDREKQARYVFTVLAKDTNVHSSNSKSLSSLQLTGTCTVTVLIDDENDNWPVFVNPNSTANTLAVAVDETLGHKLAYIQATDADDGENALITYSIRSGNTNGLFGLDSTTGLLYLSGLFRGTSTSDHDSLTKNVTVNLAGDTRVDVSPALAGPSFHMLTLEACDQGKHPKQKCTLFSNLKILINNRLDGDVDTMENDSQGGQISDSGLRRKEKAIQSRRNELMASAANGYTVGTSSGSMAYGMFANTRATGRYSINEIIIICLSVLFISVLAATILLVCLIRRRSLGYFSREKEVEDNPEIDEPDWSARKMSNPLSYTDLQSPSNPQHSDGTSDSSVKEQLKDSINECRTEPRNLETTFESDLEKSTENHGGYQPSCLTNSAYQMPPRTVDTLRRWPLISGSTIDCGVPAKFHPTMGSQANNTTGTIHPLHNHISVRPDDYQTLDYLGLVTTAVPNRYLPVYRLSPHTMMSPLAMMGSPIADLRHQQSDRIQLTHMNTLATMSTTPGSGIQISHKHSRSQPQAMNMRHNTYSQLCAPSTTVSNVDELTTEKLMTYSSRPLKASNYRSMTKSVQNMNGIHYGNGSAKYQLQSHTYYDIKQADLGVYNGRFPKSKSQHVDFSRKKSEHHGEQTFNPKSEHGTTAPTDLVAADSGVTGAENLQVTDEESSEMGTEQENNELWQHSTRKRAKQGKRLVTEAVGKKWDAARYVSAAYGEASFV
ncbi:protocadherin-11 X-linked [Clonorchis sinensis]|uniref:Protocadherin-11 X-linked n=1 Tax=Clonorchis sinensis TaxID=79923 RepID=G7Y8R9_CLOSI|nr:protocadherin-11 X-linked [Clonorchis sinensis]